MNLPLLSLVVAAVGSMVGLNHPHRSSTEGQARIEIQKGDVYLVQALYDGISEETLTYRLDVTREGVSGTSRSSQSGRFEAASGRTDTLSTLQVNVVHGDRFTAHLSVLRNGDVISETEVDEVAP